MLGLLSAPIALANEGSGSSQNHLSWFHWPVAVGTVTAVSGTTLTLTGQGGTVYTVAAVDAKIWKEGEASAISSIVVGDQIIIFGSINGSAITATKILDGFGKNIADKTKGVFFGVVTAINGTNFTLQTQGKNPKTLTVNASTAVVTKNGETVTIGSLLVNDMVKVKGALDAAGTTITATKVKVQTTIGNHKGFGWGHFFRGDR